MFVSLYQSLNKTQKAARKILREYIISIMIGLPKTYVRYVKGKHFKAILSLWKIKYLKVHSAFEVGMRFTRIKLVLFIHS